MAVAEAAGFASKLKSLRIAAGMSQYRLAQLSGVKKQTISRLEKGRHDPSWKTVQELAKGLGVEVTAFVTDNEEAGTSAEDDGDTVKSDETKDGDGQTTKKRRKRS